MAAMEEQEGNCGQFNLDDILKNLKETEKEVNESSPSPDESEGVSMFCKACLNPYSGEAKSGTIVLKCERCGQTDVVLEEKAVELDLDEWSGNLIMNRFLQVLKEQEDLKLNIIDPNFADDDYQHLTLALQEYTFNMKGIAEQMYDIARQARMEGESLEEVNHELDCLDQDTDDPNCQESQIDNLCTSAGKPSTDTNVTNDDEREGPETPSKASSNAFDGPDIGDKSNWLPLSTKDRLKKLGITVTRMMQTVIDKYNLSPDIMDKVKERIRHPSNSNAKDVEAPMENAEAENPNEGNINSIKDTVDNTTSCGDTNDLSRTDLGADGDKWNTDQTAQRQADSKTVEKKLIDDDNGDNGDVEEVAVDDERKQNPGLVFPKQEIEQEVFGVLKSKFSIRFDRPVNEEPGMVENHKKKVNKTEKNITDRIAELQEHIKSKPDSFEGASNYNLDKSERDEPETNDKEVKHGNYVDDDDDDNDYLQVNFCTVSSAFMNELQSRKQKALMERKDKALQTVHQKIVNLKKEVERVENRVHEELTMAYQRKLKKVENQRKQLDKRHETIQNVEELMTHYAETGQNDKLAELMAQLDIQYEN